MKKGFLNTKWRGTQFSAASCILWADLMQKALLRKKFLSFGKRKFPTQNEVRHSFQHGALFFEQIWWKTHFLARYPYNLENREFLTQNDAKHRFQQRVIFFERIWCKTHFLARYRYNFAKGTFSHKMKWNTVCSSELYSLSRFDAKRTF